MAFDANCFPMEERRELRYIFADCDHISLYFPVVVDRFNDSEISKDVGIIVKSIFGINYANMREMKL